MGVDLAAVVPALELAGARFCELITSAPDSALALAKSDWTVADAAAARGWGACAFTVSPLPGPSGNVEFFLWLRHGPATTGPDEIERVVSAGPPGVPGEKVIR